MAAFPPAPYDEALRQLGIYDAWYTGQIGMLPGGTGTPTSVAGGVQYSSGSYITRPIRSNSGENRSELHIPVAGDLAMLSADLLFAEAPKITLPDSQDTADRPAAPERKAAQERLEMIVSSDEGHAELLRSGEYASAHGGAYLAVVWDTSLREHVWFRAYRADCAMPEFKHGILSAVTLWTDYTKDEDVYRLLERHTPGQIKYSLFKGTDVDQGRQVSLDTIDDTAHYLKIVDVTDAERLPEAESLDVVVATGVPWLAVEYFPNMLPNPIWDKKGLLANLGRSDFFQLEPLFERINSLWSSLMRDFDNGMGRLTVPESYLKLNGPGAGAQFDMARQVYSPVGGLVDDGKGGAITISQFEIRVTEHLEGIVALKREIAQRIGYSPAHLGIQGSGSVKTATEVNADFRDSERTRDKKALYVRPALGRLSRTALAIDSLVFPGKGGQIINELPDIEFAEVSQIDPLVRAQTVQMLDAGGAISTYRKVRKAQPELDDKEAREEADEIRRERGIGTAPDPTTFDGGDAREQLTDPGADDTDPLDPPEV
jgi:hypothetical protein